MGSFTDMETKRLRLRRLTPDDAPAVFDYRSLPEVSRLQTWEPAGVEELRHSFAELIETEPGTPGTWLQLAIVLRESGRLIGDCGIRTPVDDPRQAELGISLSPGGQGAGYATEALEAALEYCFRTLDKHRVFASTDPENTPCIRLLERAGMRLEGHFRESLWFKGRWADDLIFAILEREWRDR